METEYKNSIYDRLLEIKFNVDISAIPKPQQINQKIGECHAYIEEISHFSIRIHKEMSVMTQAYNNSLAEFELKKDTLITQEPIKNLPNIKDREAQANLLLRADREKVQGYSNELNDLNNLLKAVSLKIRNLNSANADIKLQLRVLETQVKLGSGNATNAVAKSLMEEMHKSTLNQDSFEEALTEATEEKVVDPSVPMDMDKVFTEDEPEPEGLSEKLIEPVPELNPDNGEGEEIPPAEEWSVDTETVLEIEKNIDKDTDNSGINLDDVIEMNGKGGTEKTKKVEEKPVKQKTKKVEEKPVKQKTKKVEEKPVKQKTKKVEEKPVEQKTKKVENTVDQKEDHPKIDSGGIDIDDLLNDYP